MQWKGANGLTNLVVSYGRAGQDKQTLDGSAIKEADGLYRATLSDLQAFTSYEFTITGTNAAGSGVSYSGTLATNGYPAEIIVTSGGKPQRSIKVQVVGYEYTTDENGKIYLELPSGNVPIKLVSGSYSRDETLEVKAVSIGADKKASEIQQFSYTIPASALSGRLSLWWLLLPLLLVILLVVFFILKRRKDKQANQPWAPLTGAYVGGAAATLTTLGATSDASLPTENPAPIENQAPPALNELSAPTENQEPAPLDPGIDLNLPVDYSSTMTTTVQAAFPKPMDAPHTPLTASEAKEEVLDIWQQAEAQTIQPDSVIQPDTTGIDRSVNQTYTIDAPVPAAQPISQPEPTTTPTASTHVVPNKSVDLDVQSEGEMEIRR